MSAEACGKDSIWRVLQVLVALSLICGGAYLIHSITVMSFASTRLRILAWCFAPISAVLFTAFHFFAIYLTCVYYNYIRQRFGIGYSGFKPHFFELRDLFSSGMKQRNIPVFFTKYFRPFLCAVVCVRFCA